MLTNQQSRWLGVAIALANANTYRWKLGAVAVKRGHIEIGMSKRRNNPKSMSPEHLDRCSIHAEIDAVSRMRDPRGATIYVARVNKKGEIRNSKPCINCQQTLLLKGIKQVIHT